jgi:hypothetical protein
MNTLRSEAIYGKRVEIKIVYPVRNNAPLEFLTGFTEGI